MKNNLVTISSSYSPKEQTLKKKFGNLPIKYVRMHIESEEELMILDKAMRLFTFNCESEGEPILIEDEEIKNLNSTHILKSQQHLHLQYW